MKNGFYDIVWSPVVGCLNGCPYCYAEHDLTRRGIEFKKPTFYPERLTEPLRIKRRVIFCDHYTDLMGEFIPKDWIDKIIEVISQSDNEFIILTKNPKRFYEFTFPDNVTFGVTIESPDLMYRSEVLKDLKGKKIASIEPILGDFTGCDLSQFNLVVVGGMIGGKIVHGENVRTVRHDNIYYKPNIRRYLK